MKKSPEQILASLRQTVRAMSNLELVIALDETIDALARETVYNPRLELNRAIKAIYVAETLRRMDKK